jgi:predicted O-methyltransferase YrrM
MLRRSAGLIHLDVDSFVAALTGDSARGYRCEFDAALLELESRLSHQNYEAFWNLENESAWSLYALTRNLRPQHILETGVANGVSTYFLLQALRHNGTGVLHSIDTKSDVGRLLTKAERADWDLQVLSSAFPRRSASKIFTSLPPLDLFIHDSNHSYAWMRHEFTLAALAMRPGGIIASDDCDLSYAFSEFCSDRGLKANYFFDRRKLFGAVQLS